MLSFLTKEKDESVELIWDKVWPEGRQSVSDMMWAREKIGKNESNVAVENHHVYNHGKSLSNIYKWAIFHSYVK